MDGLRTRRAVLLGGAGMLLAGAGAVADVLPGGPPLRRLLGWTGEDGEIPDAPAGPVVVDRVRSAARGRDVDLVLLRPATAPTGGLPVCLALHGLRGSARTFIELGIAHFLTAAAQAGVPPFAVAAVDCGPTYYAARDPWDDPQRMLREELPGWLADRGLPAPTGLLGYSMGAFGALRLARDRGDLRAVAIASPALHETWSDVEDRPSFRDEAQWAANEPLLHTDRIAAVPLGVWCGTEDPFLDATRALIARTRPATTAITRGAHDDGYLLRVFPEMIRFIGARLGVPV